MTAPVAPAKPQGKPSGKQPVQMQFRPFVAGTRRVDKSTYDQTRTLNSSTQDLPVYECEPNGYLRGMYVLVECITAANAAAVTFSANGPFNVIDSFQLADTNNKPIIGPVTGFDLYVAIKYGGYAFVDDAKNSPVFSAVTGTGATGGSFTFVLNIPIELSKRDGLGSLTNKSSSATFDVTIRLAANATVYGVGPTAPGQVRVRIQQYGWMDPSTTDIKGNPVSQNPPAISTTQFWQKQTITLNAGAFNTRLQGLDSMIRNLVFVLMDNANSRAAGDANFPDPWQMQYETSQPVNRLKTVWRQMIAEAFGYTGAVDTANGRDSGVYPEFFTYDFAAKPGNETRLGYLPASSATNISVNGTIGGSGTHTLAVLINKVVPADGNPKSLTGR